MQFDVDFPGGARVDAQFGPFLVHTDQSRSEGGEGSAPSPFDLFLAATATCPGYYVLRFCQARGIATTGIHLVQRLEIDPTSGHVTKILIEIQLPADFPDKYKPAVIRAAEQCTVKKHLQRPPAFEIVTSRPEVIVGPKA
jgi:putative redox protein